MTDRHGGQRNAKLARMALANTPSRYPVLLERLTVPDPLAQGYVGTYSPAAAYLPSQMASCHYQSEVK